MKQEYLEIGKIVSVHGLQGDVKVQPWCDSPELLCEFDRLFRKKNGVFEPVAIEHARVQKQMVLLKLEGIHTPEQAQACRNQVLYMHRDDLELEENTYFVRDLIGMQVLDADTGFCYGVLDDVLQTGANDVYSVRGAEKTVLIPAIPDVILETNLEENTMRIRPLKGLFDDAD